MPGNLGRVNLATVSGAGEFRYRLTFAERNQVEDDFGNVSTGWADRFTVSANIIPKLGGEAVMAARLTRQQPVIIRVRKSPDMMLVNTDWKATDPNGKAYNIRTVVDPLAGDGQHGFYLDMLAETGVAV
jgi:head-tail adaptor